jgi:hypothetical protein
MNDIKVEINGKRVKEYCHIDHLDEGIGITKPDEGEEIVMVDYYCGDHSELFVVHKKRDGKVRRLVNPRDLSYIDFEEEGDKDERPNI